MTLLSDITAKVKSTRLVPPTEEEQSLSKQKINKSDEPQSKPKRPVLEITSYDRFTPPSPTPDLEYDCRITNNPSSQLRKTCTGLDAILQDELMGRSSFSDMVSRAEGDIRRLMEVKDVRAMRAGETAIVRVGCLCGSGHHRSVAFAEKLGQIQWCEQGEWEVKVQHRDLTSGVEEMKRIRSEKSRMREENKEKGTDANVQEWQCKDV
jgi:RNase adaptor protein for sRNA GlmZ degradation